MFWPLCHSHQQAKQLSKFINGNLKIKIQITIILPIALYGCETWSLTSREERRLKAFDNRMLRRVGIWV